MIMFFINMMRKFYHFQISQYDHGQYLFPTISAHCNYSIIQPFMVEFIVFTETMILTNCSFCPNITTLKTQTLSPTSVPCFQL